MGYNTLFNEFRGLLPICEEIGKLEVVTIRNADEKTYDFVFNGKRMLLLKPDTVTFLKRMQKLGPIAMIDTFCIIKLIEKGPKIFAPKQMDFELLEQVAVNVPFDDYVQPFETIMVELPKDYAKNKTVECLQKHHADKHAPDSVIIHWNAEQKILIMNLFFTSGQSFKTVMRADMGKTPEECLESLEFRKRNHESVLEMHDGEKKMCYAVLRAALNACLLMDEAGVKRRPCHNPEHYAKLQESVKRFKNQPEKLETAKRALRLFPVYYELNQEVELFKIAKSDVEYQSHTGREVGPHHRRGYYRLQPYGPGNSLRKRIRIPPVFVNAHKFIGKMSDAKVTYV